VDAFFEESVQQFQKVGLQDFSGALATGCPHKPIKYLMVRVMGVGAGKFLGVRRIFA